MNNIIEKYIRETYYYIIKVEIVSGRRRGRDEVYYKLLSSLNQFITSSKVACS